LRAH
jgi:hypothetical protein